MRTDGETDMTKLIVACRSFAKAPKNDSFFNLHQLIAVITQANAHVIRPLSIIFCA
jgi:tRNA nucleotidyltransferase (CCA-adding enzyme)